MKQNYLIVTDRPKLFSDKTDFPIVTPSEFIQNTLPKNCTPSSQLKVINCCQSFDYLSKGYYVSLLARARGWRAIPSVEQIVSLNWKRHYASYLPELNELLNKHYHHPAEEPLSRTYATYFGRHSMADLEPLTRRLFDLFRFPALTFEITYVSEKKWQIGKIEFQSISAIPSERMPHFIQALSEFTGSAWRERVEKPERYWLAILHSPDEAMAPSNKQALSKFVKIGKQMDIWVELITRTDFPSLLEYDALFIRETTAINHHTYRFASKAEQEGIPCIDDTQSIISCCNKVFQHELLSKHRIPLPHTAVIDRQQKLTLPDGFDFPVVLKIPDGSFSRGVMKAKNAKEFESHATTLLKKSEIVLCQEFVESEYDWRIGVLGGEPLFASRYFMAENHWQIYNHSETKKSLKVGKHDSMAVEEVPEAVMKVALKAAKLIGDGLYGVDLKLAKSGKVVLIEVNDNPNIDVGVEDEILGDALYKRILQHFVKLIEA